MTGSTGPTVIITSNTQITGIVDCSNNGTYVNDLYIRGTLYGSTGLVGLTGINHGDYIYWNGDEWSVGYNQISIGANAGASSQGSNSVAIGYNAGNSNQGTTSIAIGHGAGLINQYPNSIVLNASDYYTSIGLNPTTEGFFVSPVREIGDINDGYVMMYDVSNSEILYASQYGTTGPTGAQGIMGPTGAQGIMGPTGAQGIQGATGAQGIQGNNGAIGSQGIQGEQGPSGIQGNPGPAGVAGIQGIPGEQGNIGPTGATGVQGPQGLQGVVGSQGEIGPTGSQGPAGTDAESILWFDNGTTGGITGLFGGSESAGSIAFNIDTCDIWIYSPYHGWCTVAATPVNPP